MVSRPSQSTSPSGRTSTARGSTTKSWVRVESWIRQTRSRYTWKLLDSVSRARTRSRARVSTRLPRASWSATKTGWGRASGDIAAHPSLTRGGQRHRDFAGDGGVPLEELQVGGPGAPQGGAGHRLEEEGGHRLAADGARPGLRLGGGHGGLDHLPIHGGGR